MDSALSTIDIDKLSQIIGIGPHLINGLRAAGFHSACQLHQSLRWHGVRGIGPKRRAQIGTLLRQWTDQAQRRISMQLPQDVYRQIGMKYEQQRRALANQLSLLGTKLRSIQSELQQHQTELAQASTPSFTQFLKHHL